MQVQKIILGADVSQEWLDVCEHGDKTVSQFGNTRRDVDAFLKPYVGRPAAIAIEATNVYHELLAERARHFGLTVYVISGYQLRRYAECLNVRMRNDRVDAILLARFLDREIDALRPYEPPSPQHKRLMRLLKRRALLVKQRQQLNQSFTDVSELRSSVQAIAQRMTRLIQLIDKRLHELARELGWRRDLARLRKLPGIGPLNALALCAAYRSGDFPHRDPFIAFLGLDVRTKDSGKHKGRRKLTKKGNPEYRRLLHNAAMAATKAGRYFHDDYLALQAKGKSKTAALVVIARKLARLAFALLKNETDFDPSRQTGACQST